MQEWVLTALDEVKDVLAQLVFVLVSHAGHVVEHVSGIVLDQELVSTRLKVRVGRQHAGPLDERVVSSRWVGMCSRRRIIEGGKDTSRALPFNEITDNRVVKN